MKKRKLGRSSLEVPVVGFGAWAIGGWYWGGSDDDLAVRAIEAAVEHGITAFDTAPVYGFGRSEQVLGRALAGLGARRDEAVVMTKVGLRWDDPHGDTFFQAEGPDGKPLAIRRNARPDSMRTEIERSLERLRVECIDLVQVHWPDPLTPIAETMGALVELRSEGKLREIGVSNYTPQMMDEAQAALGDVPLASDQPRYSLVAREIEADVLPYARAKGVGVLVYSPLEQGLLTGKVDAARTFPQTDGRHKRPTFRPANRRLVNAALEAAVGPVAKRLGATTAQTVIAWTVAQPGVTSALVGARTPEQAQENAVTGDLELTNEDLTSIRAAFESLALDLSEGGRSTTGLRSWARRLLGRS